MIFANLIFFALISIPLLKSPDAQANFYGYMTLIISMILLLFEIGYEAYIKDIKETTRKKIKIGDIVLKKFDDKGNLIRFKENSTEYLIKNIKEEHVLLENTLSKGLVEESIHSIHVNYKDSNFNHF